MQGSFNGELRGDLGREMGGKRVIRRVVVAYSEEEEEVCANGRWGDWDRPQDRFLAAVLSHSR